jgi:hypothetical protein
MMKIFGTFLTILLMIHTGTAFAEDAVLSSALTEATYAGTGGPTGADTDECNCKEYQDVNNPNGLTAATEAARKAASFQNLATGAGTVAIPKSPGTGAQ